MYTKNRSYFACFVDKPSLFTKRGDTIYLMKTKGFTLIELLMVIAIVSLLSSIAMGPLQEAREKGRIAAGQKFSSSLHHAIGDELIGEWKFDQDTFDDTSGWENDGTPLGGLGAVDDFVEGVMS